jgi:hypothetical protein
LLALLLVLLAQLADSTHGLSAKYVHQKTQQFH